MQRINEKENKNVNPQKPVKIKDNSNRNPKPNKESK